MCKMHLIAPKALTNSNINSNSKNLIYISSESSMGETPGLIHYKANFLFGCTGVGALPSSFFGYIHIWVAMLSWWIDPLLWKSITAQSSLISMNDTYYLFTRSSYLLILWKYIQTILDQFFSKSWAKLRLFRSPEHWNIMVPLIFISYLLNNKTM